ncbi:hypothetical protein [Cohnella sp. REN36]|uniref:hypothetical protein n=1 Tax=Cohnella sp. REN36 TaxID=2887347 RepID=UPI001D1344C5|nr:hypothetical protein [Cohnella sp. REN36]MCC3374100.1 hypothetical protein [Cohnella sp. REN36]
MNLFKFGRETNIINAIIIVVTSLMSFVALESLVLEFFTIKSSLWLLSLIHLVFSSYILYKRKIVPVKEWECKLIGWDIAAIVMSLAATFGFSVYYYTLDLSVRFETSDPAIHFFLSKKFAQTSHLALTSTDLFPFQHLSTYPFLDYVNTGLLMKVFYFIDNINVYMVGNLFLFSLTILLIYALLKEFIKYDLFIFISMMVLACTGYNLNSVIWGFSSQMAGIIMILSLLLINKTLKNKIDRGVYLSLVALHVLGVLFAYYYFAPVILASVVIQELVIRKKINIRSLFCLENIVYVGSFVVFAYIYLVHFGSNIENGNISSVKLEGYITRDLYSTFAPLLLFAVFVTLNWIKERKFEFILILLSCLLLFAGIILIAGLQGYASSYYFYKNHFVIGLLLIILYAIGLSKVKEKSKALYISYVICILFFTLQYTWFDKYINQKNALFNPVAPNYVGQVFTINKIKLNQTEVILNGEEKAILNEIKNNKALYLNGADYLPVLGGSLQLLWFEISTEIWPSYDDRTLYALFDETVKMDIKKWEQDPLKNPYLLVIGGKGREAFSERADISHYKIIFSTKSKSTVLYKYFSN